jgi:uncharacterized protein (DUF302 family)
MKRLLARWRLGSARRKIGRQFGNKRLPLTRPGSSSPRRLTLFFQVEHSFLLSLIGKTSRATQYTIGNPLLATQMTRHMPEAGLYAPLKLVIYEDEERRTFVAYDGFVSLLAQYQRDEITQVARVVEQKLEALITEVTTGGRA